MQLETNFLPTAIQANPSGVHDGMNIEEEAATFVEARTCGEKNRRVAYKFMDGFHTLCIDKKDIILAEIEACQALLRDCHDEGDRNAIDRDFRAKNGA